MQYKFYTIMLLITFVLLLIGFECQSAKVRKLEKIENAYMELEEIEPSDNLYLQCCPLCKSSHVDFVYGITNIQVYCKTCGLTTGYYDSYSKATEEWNSLKKIMN